MPGRRLQLSLQRLSLPQAPHPEAWLEARWHGCSALAACKWIAAPPAPVLITLSPDPQAPGVPSSGQSALIEEKPTGSVAQPGVLEKAGVIGSIEGFEVGGWRFEVFVIHIVPVNVNVPVRKPLHRFPEIHSSMLHHEVYHAAVRSAHEAAEGVSPK